jgi:hypothetical protein
MKNFGSLRRSRGAIKGREHKKQQSLFVNIQQRMVKNSGSTWASVAIGLDL